MRVTELSCAASVWLLLCMRLVLYRCGCGVWWCGVGALVPLDLGGPYGRHKSVEWLDVVYMSWVWLRIA